MNNRERQKEIILQLKQIKRERELSALDIYMMVKAAGLPTSESSVRRVFAEGSEEQNFRYQDTIQPIAQVLIGVKEEGEPLNPSEADALKNIALLKDSMINDLQKENFELKSRIDSLESALAEEKLRAEFLIGQIKIKDDQNARKDWWIDFLKDRLVNLDGKD